MSITSNLPQKSNFRQSERPAAKKARMAFLTPAVQTDNEAIFTNAAVLVSPIFPELNLKAEEILPNIGAIKNN